MRSKFQQDRFTKIIHFIPTIKKTSAEGLARLFRDNVWKLHRLSKSIISDRRLQFAAGLMRELNKMLKIKSKMSIVFHPQTELLLLYDHCHLLIL